MVKSSLRSLALFPFVRRLGISYGDFDDLVEEACGEVMDLALKPYFPL